MLISTLLILLKVSCNQEEATTLLNVEALSTALLSAKYGASHSISQTALLSAQHKGYFRSDLICMQSTPSTASPPISRWDQKEWGDLEENARSLSSSGAARLAIQPALNIYSTAMTASRSSTGQLSHTGLRLLVPWRSALCPAIGLEKLPILSDVQSVALSTELLRIRRKGS